MLKYFLTFLNEQETAYVANGQKVTNAIELWRKEEEQEGFLRCQTPTSTVRLKVEGCRLNYGWCKIKSE